MANDTSTTWSWSEAALSVAGVLDAVVRDLRPPVWTANRAADATA